MPSPASRPCSDEHKKLLCKLILAKENRDWYAERDAIQSIQKLATQTAEKNAWQASLTVCKQDIVRRNKARLQKIKMHWRDAKLDQVPTKQYHHFRYNEAARAHDAEIAHVASQSLYRERMQPELSTRVNEEIPHNTARVMMGSDSHSHLVDQDDEKTPPADTIASQASQTGIPYSDEFQCAVCLELMVEPSTTPCKHSFCQTCIITASEQSMHCPLCRTALPPYYVAPVDEILWSKVKSECRVQLAPRLKSAARIETSLSVLAIINHRKRQEKNDTLRQLMRVNRSQLISSCPDYFEKLEIELESGGGIFRCKCSARFVCLRRRLRTPGANLGREYVSCPLYRWGAPPREGCGFFEYVL